VQSVTATAAKLGGWGSVLLYFLFPAVADHLRVLG